MGHKVNPKIFRIGTVNTWESKWFAMRREYAKLLREDVKIKAFLAEKLKESAVDRIEIERTPHAVTVTVHSAKPGFIIGRAGTGVEDLKKQLRTFVAKGKEKMNLNLNVVEVTKPSLSANIVLQGMIADIERRLPFRRVLKQNIDRVQKGGGKGVKLIISGRLNGAEIARREMLSWGSIPLHNLRADIDYASGFAKTLFGTIGIKVYIYRGEVFNKKEAVVAAPARAEAPARRAAVKAAPSHGVVPAKAGVRPLEG